MKRAGWTIAVVLLLMGSLAMAQIRGVPASVTSFGFGGSRSATPGPPASVTSLGPNGFAGTPPINFRSVHVPRHQRNFFNNPCGNGVTPLIPSALGCTNPAFNTFVGAGGVQIGGTVNAGRRHNRSFVPVYVPYAYPYPVVVDDSAQPEGYAVSEEPEPPAPTVFEHRPEYMPYASDEGAPYTRAPRPQASAAPASAPAPEEPARPSTPTVLIYKDGHEVEVNNYAIVGSTLYNLGTFVAQKIPLDQLNLQATVKANEDRGVEFTVPASVKGQ